MVSLERGNVFNIQKYSVHDGPGIRTMVFLKGCPLRCHWCSNPESQLSVPQLGFNESRCLGLADCQLCLSACPRKALESGSVRPVLNRENCQGCQDFQCSRACPARSLVVYGEEMLADSVLKEAEKDAVFYARSGGGLTVSGGEPLMQPNFTLELLSQARRKRLKTALETSGYASYEVFKKVAPLLDALMYDVKCVDGSEHLRLTGVDNSLILENLIRLRRDFPNLSVRVRTPLVPGYTDGDIKARDVGHFLREIPGTDYEVLPYHRLGSLKYGYLGRSYPLGDVVLAEGAELEFRRVVDEARLGSGISGVVSSLRPIH